MTWFDYLRDPAQIERDSFSQIRELTDLRRFDEDQAQVAMRLVHTCGEPSMVNDLHFSPKAVDAGIAALHAGNPILCDVEMVRHGISQRYISSPLLCFLNDERTPSLASTRQETRSMAALSLWREHLAGSVVVIGNAPTALFRLLEMLLDGADAPALIIGMPVGFIGAAESKAALLNVGSQLGIESICLSGRRGGSALATASVNCLARLAAGVRL